MKNSKIEYVPCILKSDTLERGITDDVIQFLCNRFVVRIIGEIMLSRCDVITYKYDEWLHDRMGVPEGFFRECILEYEASNVLVLMLYCNKEITFDDLVTIKGRHFLPYKCASNSVRGYFKDEKQLNQLVAINGKILEQLPDGRIIFPRNIIHIPDCKVSVSRLCSILEQKGIRL